MIAGTDMEGADVVTILRKAYGMTTAIKVTINRQDLLFTAVHVKRLHDFRQEQTRVFSTTPPKVGTTHSTGTA